MTNSARDSDICGYQLMTERERAQYRERMRRGIGEELDTLVDEHRERMQVRAKERGAVLLCDKGGEARQIKGTEAWLSLVGLQRGLHREPGR